MPGKKDSSCSPQLALVQALVPGTELQVLALYLAEGLSCRVRKAAVMTQGKLSWWAVLGNTQGGDCFLGKANLGNCTKQGGQQVVACPATGKVVRMHI